MISLKSYLSRDTEAETAYRRIIGLFLQGISLHAVEGDKADHERFQEDIDKCLSVLSPKTPVSELLLVVGGALRAMEDYNQRTSKFCPPPKHRTAAYALHAHPDHYYHRRQQ